MIGTSQAFYPTHFPEPGHAEQDPGLILSSIVQIVKACTKEHRDHISAISLSSAMHSLLALDDNGNPLTPLIIWSDMRSAAQARTVREQPLHDELYHETGTPVHPMSPLCKLLWLKEKESDLFTHAARFISIKEYVVHALCGHYTVDYSVASSTGMFDVHHLTWSKRALSLTGVDEKKLSKCVSPYTSLMLTPSAADLLGFTQSVPVVMGASDGCLANLGSGATAAGELSITIGTSGAVRMISGTPAMDLKKRIFNYRLDESSFVVGGATNNGTVLIDWFEKRIRQRDADLVAFVDTAHDVGPGADGLLFLPFVFGERAPFHNPDMRGVFFGLAQHHSTPHLMRSLLEGICFEVKALVESVEETVSPVTRVLASGGFVRSDRWVQLLADVIGQQVQVRDTVDASSLGAAIVGFKSTGIAAAFTHSNVGKMFVPAMKNRATYEKTYKLFSSITQKLQVDFQTIAELQNTHLGQ